MKTVLITGAAGGVGRALAQAFAAQGQALILTDRDKGALADAAGQLTAPGEQIVADLRDAADLARLAARLESTEQPVDILVNNAGVIVPGPVGRIDDDVMRAHIDINMTAPMLLSAAAARAMKKRQAGTIFSVISLAAMAPMKDSASYSASKFGVRGFMASLSLELRPHGVSVGAVYPSAIDTPMLAAEMASPDGSPLNFVGNAKPMAPDAVAAAVLKAIDKGRLETWLPKSDGYLAGIVMLFPKMLQPILTYLEKGGTKKKQAYLKRLRDEGSLN